MKTKYKILLVLPYLIAHIILFINAGKLEKHSKNEAAVEKSIYKPADSITHLTDLRHSGIDTITQMK